MNRRTRRVIFFAGSILVGIALGLVYGWMINPVQFTNTGPDTLRRDFQTDYVLMVGELYRAEGDLPLAAARLTYLGAPSPSVLLADALSFAAENAFSPGDVEAIAALAPAVELIGLASE